MNKLKLFGVIKSPTHVVYHIEKKEYFLKHFREFLHSLDFTRLESAKLLSLLGDSGDNYSARSYCNELYQDEYFYFEKNQYKINLFFGKERIIVSIFTKDDKQQELTEKILHFCKLQK